MCVALLLGELLLLLECYCRCFSLARSLSHPTAYSYELCSCCCLWQLHSNRMHISGHMYSTDACMHAWCAVGHKIIPNRLHLCIGIHKHIPIFQSFELICALARILALTNYCECELKHLNVHSHTNRCDPKRLN